MVIAVNARFLLAGYLEGFGNYTNECFQRIARNNPTHQFIYIFDRPYDSRFISGPNIKGVVIGPAARHPLLWKFWYDVKLPAVLRKYKADVFVSPDGFGSLRTSCPQCIVVHDLAFLQDASFINKWQRWFYRRYTPRFIRKAESIITVSAFSKAAIIWHYPEASSKLTVVHNGVKEIFRPVDDEVKKTVKEKYSGGKEYFIYVGAVHPRKNLMMLLKAFSVFKKRQQTTMKLVIAGRLAWNYKTFLHDLSNYKYRNDVVMTGYLPDEELAQVLGAAYALVYPSLYEGFGVPVLEAMQAGVPVITAVNSAMQEIAGEAALYADVTSFNSIANKMMRVFTDENLKLKLTADGLEVAKSYEWDKAATACWEVIAATAAAKCKIETSR